MAELLSPGVFIEEKAADLQTIQAVSTSNCGFTGFTPRGPSDLATLVTSYPDAVRKFGGITRKSFMGYCLAAFFQNGGSRAFISRVTPADAVAASAKVQSKTTDQQIETGATGTAAFTKTAGTSLLKDNGGVTPLVTRSVTFRWRSAGLVASSQIARKRDGSTALTSVAAQAYYEGRIDLKATRLIAGVDANGGVYYRSVADYGTAVEVTQINAGANQALSVSVSGSRVLVNLATDAGAVVTSTAAQVAAAVTGSVAAAALLTATATGTGAGLVLAAEVLPLSGLAAFDGALDRITPGSLKVTWQAGGASKSVAFTGVVTTPTQTVSNVAGSSVTLDLRTGVFALTCHATETPAGPDAGVSVTVAYTPGVDRSITDDGAGVFAAGSTLTAPGAISYTDGSYSFTTIAPASAVKAIGAGGDGTVNITVDQPGTLGNEYTVAIVVPGGTSPLSAVLNGTALTVNLDVTVGVPTVGANTATLIAAAIAALPGLSATATGTGADEITVAAAASAFTGGLTDTRPHNLARVLATYKIAAWALEPISKGEWGSDLRLVLVGEVNYYTPATASYSAWRAYVQLYNSESGQYDTVETFEELSLTDPNSAQYWVDVLNETSDYVIVDSAGGDEAPGELNGISRSVVIGAGDESSTGQTFQTTLANGPIAGRSVTLTYTDTTGTTRTITDNGFGVLSGSVDTTYATTVGDLGPNRINPTTGQINVRTLYALRHGTVATVTYRSAPEETQHTEDFGDTDKGYTAGSDGTFDSTNYGRSQISDSTVLEADAKGIYALNQIDEIMQVVVPDFAGDTTVSQDLVDFAEARVASNPSGGDRFIILTTPRASSAQEAADWVQNQLLRRSKYAAVYWPWIRVGDPLQNNRLLTMPPIAHVAGVYARTDATRNVGKAPAGTVDGQLRYISELEYVPTQGDRDYVFPRLVNPLRSDAMVGTAVWGSYTLAASSAWRNVNAVRLFMFVEKSVFNATHWICFENNGPGLWSRIKLQLDGFLGNLFVDGYFAGSTRAEAYEVIVDDTNNPQAVIDSGQVVTDVAIAPNKSAYFARFRFAQRSLAT